MAFGSALWAQALAGSGVGTAAAALPDGAADAADAAGAEAAGADGAPVPPDGALDDVVDEQAANSKIAMNARAGNLRRLLIPCSSSVEPAGPPRFALLPMPGERYTSTDAIECVHSFAMVFQTRREHLTTDLGTEAT
jgi:hypothetical protein